MCDAAVRLRPDTKSGDDVGSPCEDPRLRNDAAHDRGFAAWLVLNLVKLTIKSSSRLQNTC